MCGVGVDVVVRDGCVVGGVAVSVANGAVVDFSRPCGVGVGIVVVDVGVVVRCGCC